MTMKTDTLGAHCGNATGLRASQGSAFANVCKGLHASTERPTGHEL